MGAGSSGNSFSRPLRYLSMASWTDRNVVVNFSIFPFLISAVWCRAHVPSANTSSWIPTRPKWRPTSLLGRPKAFSIRLRILILLFACQIRLSWFASLGRRQTELFVMSAIYRGRFVERFRSYISSVRPSYRTTIKKKFLEKTFSLMAQKLLLPAISRSPRCFEYHRRK